MKKLMALLGLSVLIWSSCKPKEEESSAPCYIGKFAVGNCYPKSDYLDIKADGTAIWYASATDCAHITPYDLQGNLKWQIKNDSIFLEVTKYVQIKGGVENSNFDNNLSSVSYWVFRRGREKDAAKFSCTKTELSLDFKVYSNSDDNTPRTYKRL